MCFKRLWAHTVVLCIVQTTVANSDLRRCAKIYKAQLPHLRELSSAITELADRHHKGDDVWEHLLSRERGLRRDDMLASIASVPFEKGRDYEAWVEHLLGAARGQLLGCWVNGGRFFEVDFDLPAYASALPSNSSFLSRRFLYRLGATAGSGDLIPMRSSLCVPHECETYMFETAVLPRYFAYLLGIRARLPAFLPGQHATFSELTDWAHLSLDFVVAGVDNCGTTSLRRNLAKHPEIGFTSEDIDLDFWFKHVKRRLLPRKTHVDDFNRLRSDRPSILGLYSLSILTDVRNRLAMQLLPNLRAIVILCDPVGRIEKRYYTNRCKRRLDESARDCRTSIAHALDEPGFVESELVGHHLREMRDLFGQRLLVLHQESLRTEPDITYNRLAAFLGAQQPFPAGSSFPRYNSLGGHRTDLCHNMSLVKRFQSRFTTEYKHYWDALQSERLSLPPTFRLRRTRCERPEELSLHASSCDASTPCNS